MNRQMRPVSGHSYDQFKALMEDCQKCLPGLIEQAMEESNLCRKKAHFETDFGMTEGIH